MSEVKHDLSNLKGVLMKLRDISRHLARHKYKYAEDSIKEVHRLHNLATEMANENELKMKYFTENHAQKIIEIANFIRTSKIVKFPNLLDLGDTPQKPKTQFANPIVNPLSFSAIANNAATGAVPKKIIFGENPNWRQQPNLDDESRIPHVNKGKRQMHFLSHPDCKQYVDGSITIKNIKGDEILQYEGYSKTVNLVSDGPTNTIEYKFTPIQEENESESSDYEDVPEKKENKPRSKKKNSRSHLCSRTKNRRKYKQNSTDETS